MDEVFIPEPDEAGSSPDIQAELLTPQPELSRPMHDEPLPIEPVPVHLTKKPYPDYLDYRELAKSAQTIIGQQRTITHQEQEAEALEDRARQAELDALTGLRNTRLFNHSMEGFLNRAKRDGRHVPVAAIDVDDFRTVNNTLGHHVGDEVLKAIAKGMDGASRPGDLTFRLGGDEFFVIFNDSEVAIDDEHATNLVNLLTERLRRSITDATAATGHRCDVSVGIAFSEFNDTPQTLRIRADEASYADKATKSERQRQFSATGNNS